MTRRSYAAPIDAVEAMTIDLPALPMKQLSPNAFKALHRWAQTSAIQGQREAWLVMLHERLGPPPYPEFDTYTITFRLYGVGMRTDTGSWCGHWGLKVLEDCLTRPRANKFYGLGILIDDSPKYYKQRNVEVYPDGEARTVVTITSVEA